MKCHLRTIACGSLVALVAVLALGLAGCGGKESMASKSAAAYADAQKKGLPVSGGQHGGHEAEATASASAEPSAMGRMDHSTMTGMDHSTTSGMDHGATAQSPKAGMDHGAMAGMKHANMPPGDAPMSGMDHSKMPGMQHGSTPKQRSMAGMQHGGMAGMSGMAGMQHGATSTSVKVVTGAPRSNGEMAGVQPGSTLRTDDFDSPAPVSVAEAAKASGGMSMRGLEMPAGQPMNHQQHSMAPPPNAVPNAAPVEGVYTCLMHPEVTSATPGKCPKCGMTLVKKTAKKDK